MERSRLNPRRVGKLAHSGSNRRRHRGRAPVVTIGRAPQPTSLTHLRDVFRLRCDARAELVTACLMDFHEAIDGLQDLVEKYGLDQDEAQAAMAEAFANVPRPGELEDAVVELIGILEDMLVERTSCRNDVAASTLAAADYLIKQNDPARLRTWLANRTDEQCAAILSYLEKRGV